ncbi:hypothetical protein OAA60_02340 [Porticoccaceae bacterium]|nr:hypothetical protein [Porticoccaceae bacterium]
MSIYGNVSAQDGFSSEEIDYVKGLIASGQVTAQDIANQFNIPLETVNAFAPAVVDESGEGNGLFETLSTGNTLFNAGQNIYSGLSGLNAANTANAAVINNVGSNSPWALNVGGADSAVIDAAAATDAFTGGLSSAVGALSGQESKTETAALSVLGAINPAAALAYRLFDALDLFGGGGLEATPMTDEERAEYNAQQRLDFVSNAANLSGEGGDALLSEAIALAEAQGLSVDSVLSNIESEYADLSNTLRTDDGFVSGTAPIFTGGDTQVKNVGDEYYDQFTQDELAAMNAANDYVVDLGLNVGQGTLTGVRNTFFDPFGAENMVSSQMKDWEDSIGDLMSDATKEDRATIAAIREAALGQGAPAELKAAWDAFLVNPGMGIANAIGTSIAPLVTGGVAGKAAQTINKAAQAGDKALDVGKVITTTNTVAGGLTGTGIAKDAMYESAYDYAIQNGATDDEAVMAANAAQAYTLENAPYLLANTAAGGLAGLGGLEDVVKRGLTGLGTSSVSTVAKDAIAESAGEFLEGSAEALAANAAEIGLGSDIDLTDGVLFGGGFESLIGGGTGGTISGASAVVDGGAGTEGIADTNINDNALASTVEDNALLSDSTASDADVTRDLATQPKAVNEVTTEEIASIENTIEEAGLSTEGSAATQTNQQTVSGLANVANSAVGLFGMGAAAITAVIYAANKSGASSAQIAEATGLTVDQVNKAAQDAGTTVNNQGNTLTVTGEAATAEQQAAADAASAAFAAASALASASALAVASKAARDAAAAS